MQRPTFREITEAIGYSLGNVARWTSAVHLRIRQLVSPVLIGVLVGMSLPVSVEISRWIETSANPPVFLVVAIGFTLMWASVFTMVLFGYLTVLVRPHSRVSRNIQTFAEKLAHPMVQVDSSSMPVASSSFTPYDEERAAYQEQLENLQKDGFLSGIDLDDLLKEGNLQELTRKTARSEDA